MGGSPALPSTRSPWLMRSFMAHVKDYLRVDIRARKHSERYFILISPCEIDTRAFPPIVVMMELLSNRKWRELLGRYIYGLKETE